MSKVITEFTDKASKKRYFVGDTYDGSPDRIKELTAKGVLEKEKKEAQPTSKKKG